MKHRSLEVIVALGWSKIVILHNPAPSWTHQEVLKRMHEQHLLKRPGTDFSREKHLFYRMLAERKSREEVDPAIALEIEVELAHAEES